MGRKEKLGLLWLITAALFSCSSVPQVQAPHQSQIDFWNFLFDKAQPWTLTPGVRGLVIPHHLCDDQILTRVWMSAASIRPSMVVLISPDHFFKVSQKIIGPLNAQFQGPFGDVPLGKQVLSSLEKTGAVVLNDESFPDEHGITSHLPFLSRFLPGVPVVPIIVKAGTTQEDLNKLYRGLSAWIPKDALTVASVDFSHYNYQKVSQFHDSASRRALESGDLESILSLEVDSPESLYVITALMKSRGFGHAQVFHRTDLQDYYQKKIADNTSHLYVEYLPGDPVGERPLNLMIFGKGPEELLPAFPLNSWNWHPSDPDRTKRLYPNLSTLAGDGEEDRFFMGSQVYLFPRRDRRDPEIKDLKIIETQLDPNSEEWKTLSQTQDWDLVINTPPVASEPKWFIQGKTLVVESLGWLLPPRDLKQPKGMVLGLEWSRQWGWKVNAFPLDFRDGIPFDPQRPLGKSYQALEPLGPEWSIE